MITLKDIEYNFYVGDRNYYTAIKEFLGAFKGDVDEIISSNSLMYREGTDISLGDKRVLDKQLGIKYGNPYSFKVELKLDGLLSEFFGSNQSYIMLPRLVKTSNVVPIKYETILRYFIKELVKSGYLSDKYYLVIAPLLRVFPLGYNSKINKIGFLQEDIESKTSYSNSAGNTKRLGSLETQGNISLEDILEKEKELGYVNKDIGDPNREYAYGHSLRQHANYFMLQWTRRVMMNWKKINVVAASKGNGKSYLAAEICSLELMRGGKGFGGRKRRQIKYFVPDLNTVGSNVMEYMEGFLGDLTKLKVNGEYVIKINKARYEITCSITNTTFKMISLHGFGNGSTGEGLACDFAVIDEAMYIPDGFWTLFSQRAMMETEAMLIITTISEKTPRDHWFYKLLIDGELGDELISSTRADILEKRELYELDYKNNTPVVTEDDYTLMNNKLDSIMDFTVKTLKEAGIKEFYARAYCVILDEKNVFNITGNIVPDIPLAGNERDYYILALDFGGNTDPAGVVLINLTKRTTAYIEELRGVPYLEQLNVAKLWKQRLKNLIVVGDATTIGKVIMQEDTIKDCIVDYWVQFTGAGDWSYNNKGFYVVSKRHMVETTALMLDKGVLTIAQSHSVLINQMKNFVKISGTKSLVNKYQGKGTMHDDLVDGLMMCNFVAVTILGLNEIKTWESYGVEFDIQDTFEYNENNYKQEYNNSLSVY